MRPWAARAHACWLPVAVALVGLPLVDAFLACFCLFALMHLHLCKWPPGTWQQRGMCVMVLMALSPLHGGVRYFRL